MDIRKYFTSQSKSSKTTEDKKKITSKPENISKAKNSKRPSLVIESDSGDEVIPSKRLKSNKKSNAENPLPTPNKTKKGAKSLSSKKWSPPEDEDPLPPRKNKNSKAKDDIEISDSGDEVIPSKRLKSTKKSNAENPLPTPNKTKKETKSLSSKKWSPPEDEDPLPPRKNKNSKAKDDIEISDDEDPLPKRKATRLNRRCIIEDSDEEVDFVQSKAKKTIEKKKPLKKEEKKTILSAFEFFGAAPAQRSSKTSSEKPAKVLKKEDFFPEKKISTKSQVPSEDITQDNKRKETTKQEGANKINEKVSPKPTLNLTQKVPTPKSDNKSETTPKSGRKSSNAAAYQSYLNRAGPSAPGSKEIPQGASNCLQGLTFVITGVLESLERDEISEIIKKYGGKVTQSISKNTSYMIVGVEAGPAKLEKAEKLGTKQLTEDSFLDLIRSSQKQNSCEKTISSRKTLFSANEKNQSDIDKKVDPEKENPVSDNKTLEIVKKESKIKEEKINKIIGSDKKASDFKSSNVCKAEMPSLMWVDKYKPSNINQIIGQQGPRSNVQKLKFWLSKWYSNNIGQGKSKKAGYGKWGSDDGSFFKAALLSGPPGVGKTTTAQLVCKDLDFTFIELNASDTRSKKSLETIVAEMVHNKSLSHLMKGNSKDAHRHCLLMDEVDGMAGNEDRGGVQQLIQLIKSSQIPIICMCNDRQHQKIRSLANYCFDLRFQKPAVDSLKAAMTLVCNKENLHISSQSLEDIIVGANQDVRQILHNISMWTVNDRNLNENDAAKEAKKAKKDIKIGPFDALRLVFSTDAHKTMSIHDKSDLFFYDYALSGLFVQENYLTIKPDNVENKELIDLYSKAADSICDGDLVDKLVRSQGHWNLLPTEAMFASVIPGHILEGRLTQMVNFPSWLGRNSTRNKNDRILQELHLHTRLKISGSKVDLNCDYLPYLRNAVINSIIKRQQEGIKDAIMVMNEYSLQREDLDSIIDVCTWPKQENPLKSLPPQVKAAFTRAYNKESKPNPYAVGNVSKKRAKVSNTEGDDEENLTGDEGEEEEDDDLSKDAMIKKKAQPKKKTDKKNAKQ